MLITSCRILRSATDNWSQCRPSIRGHSLSNGLPDDAQSHEADCSWGNDHAAAVARSAVRQCTGARVNGGAILWTENVADQCGADKRVDPEWSSGGTGSFVGSTGSAAFVDCGLVLVPKHGGHLREAPLELAAA